MPKVKNISGLDLVVPGLSGGRLVMAGQVVDVDDVYGYTQQTATWAPADDDATAAHDEADAAYQASVAVVEAQQSAEPPAVPLGNASRDEWATYVLATNRATEADIDGLGRDEIRDTFGSN